jgi:hypothetical protein
MADGVIAQRAPVVRAEPFIVTAFLGAALIFLVQPMFARMATPLLGGAPAVWNVSLVCFQAALLCGYAYAHVLQRFGSVKTQVMVHAFVLVAGFVCLPLHISDLMGPPPANDVQLWLLGTFALSIAPPFAALSATAPLIQAWYARSGLKDAADPYHLYAASNIGSMIGLAAYPILIEPFTALADQSAGWTIGYVMLAGVLLYSGWSITRGPVELPVAMKGEAAAKLSWRQRGMWLALSFVPSSLLVGATSHITTDVAAAPFLWAPPLMIYLLTFVLAFSKKPAIPHEFTVVLAPLAAAFALLMLSGGGPNSIAMMLGSDLFALFIIALACHGALNAKRPGAEHLTQFYLIMSLGGVLGGAFNALLAPVIFDNVFEYPLMLIAGVALLSAGGKQKISRTVWVLIGASVVALAAAITLKAMHIEAQPAMRLAMIAPSVAAIILSRRAPLGAAIALACAWPTGGTFEKYQPAWADRSFFGVVKIIDAPPTDDIPQSVRLMLHGTTIHGAQATSGDPLRPRTYYAPSTPIGQAFRLYTDVRSIGVVGLGIGSTACYSRADQDWTFYEIDPLVVQVATDPSRFTFMSTCRPGANIVVGDARIKLADKPVRAFDLMLLDAFSSDSVPTHLLTREAMQLYLSRLSDEGVLVFHISNRHLALAQVVARVTEASGAHALRQVYHPTQDEMRMGASASEVVLVSRSQAQLARAAATGKWQPLAADGGRAWTDDYSNIIGAMIDRSHGE